MTRMRFTLVALATTLAAASAAPQAYAQPAGSQTTPGAAFPNKPVRIVTGGIGTNSESVTRLVSLALPEALGQPVVVDSRGGLISMEAVLKSPADGYTLLIQGSGVWLLPLMRGNVPWDPLKDFAPVTMVCSAPGVLVVHPSLPVKSVKELIALAKAHPGALNYGSGNTGSTSHLGPELFKAMAGVNIVRVSYKGSGQALTAVMSGEVHMTIAAGGAVAPLIKSGRIRALALSDGRRSALVPGLPTVAEAGLPGYEAGSMTGMFAPAKTPDAVIRRLHQATVQVLARQDTRDKFSSVGVEPMGNTPEEMAAMLRGEVTRLGKVIKDAGIRDD